MINLEIPKKFKPLVSQANQVATEVFRPISRKYDEAEHAYPKELDMLAVADRRHERRPASIGGAGAAGVRRETTRRRRREPQRHQPVDGARHHRALLGRRRPAALDAAPGPRQLGDRLGGDRGAARALRRQVGGDGDHRAGSRLGLGRDPHHGRARRRRVRAQRREDLRHLGRPRRPDRRLGDARPLEGPGGDQVVRRRARQPGPEARPARAQARDPRLRHRELHPAGLPGAEGGPARQPGGRRQAGLRRGDADLRQHAPAGRRRWRSACARAALEETREQPRRGGRRGRLRDPRPLPARRRGALPGDGGRLRGRAAC